MKNLLIVALLCVLFAGCAGTSLNVLKPLEPGTSGKFTYQLTPKVDVSAEALTIMNERLRSQLAESLELSPNQSTKKVEITITKYRMRHGAARALVGIMAGTDNIASRVTVTDAVSGTILADYIVNSLNDSAWGTSRGLIEEHIDKVVAYLKTGRL